PPATARRRRGARTGGANTVMDEPFTPAAIADIVEASDPRVSPDGRWVALVDTRVALDDNSYHQRIWVVPADGSAPPTALTDEGGRAVRPRWSPDGTRIAYVESEEPEAGLAGARIWVVAATG